MTIDIKSIKIFLEKNYGIKAVFIKRIKKGVINFNYRIKAGEKEYLFKIYKWRTPQEVGFETGILERLRIKKFPSPRILKSKNRRLYLFFQKRPAILLYYIPGPALSKISCLTLCKIGLLAGRFHKILRRHKQDIKKDCRLSPPPEEFKKFLKLEVGKNLAAKKFTDFIFNEFKKIHLPSNLPSGITHQDIKPENIIVDKRGRMHFIDFDNCCKGIFLHDFMTIVIWTCFEKGKLRRDFLESLIRGYEIERELTKKEKKYFYNALLFRLLREAFVWGPTRFNSRIAKINSRKFLSAYKNLEKYKDSTTFLCKR